MRTNGMAPCPLNINHFTVISGLWQREAAERKSRLDLGRLSQSSGTQFGVRQWGIESTVSDTLGTAISAII